MNTNDFNDGLSKAFTALEQDRLEEALSGFDALYSMQPESPQVVFGKAVTQLKQDNMAEAIKNLETVLELLPGYKPAQSLLMNIEGVTSIDITQQLKMGHLIRRLRTLMKSKIGQPVNGLEIGTIRSYDEKHESSRHIGETLGSHGSLISVDIAPESISVAKDICKHLNNITWFQNDSVSYLRQAFDQGMNFDFILLDGANDRELTCEEFALAVRLLKRGGFIAIDDAGVATDGSTPDPTQPLAQKAQKVYELLERNGIASEVVQSIQGTQLIVEYENCMRAQSIFRMPL